MPYLFTSEALVKLIEITTSIKTKIAIISSVGPRLIDPRVKMEYFVALFRFAEEKQIVEDVLKTRAQAISAALFNKSPLTGQLLSHNLVFNWPSQTTFYEHYLTSCFLRFS